MTHAPLTARDALIGMVLAISFVTGMCLFDSLLFAQKDAQPLFTQRDTPQATSWMFSPIEAPVFIVTAEFGSFSGWTPATIADAIREPFSVLGVVVLLRPETRDGGGLYNGGSYDFSMRVARMFHAIIKPRNSVAHFDPA